MEECPGRAVCGEHPLEEGCAGPGWQGEALVVVGKGPSDPERTLCLRGREAGCE